MPIEKKFELQMWTDVQMVGMRHVYAKLETGL